MTDDRKTAEVAASEESPVAFTALPTESEVARMLGVDQTTLARCASAILLGGASRRYSSTDVLTLNERVERRLRGELAAELVDLAWERVPHHAPVVEREVNEWLDAHPPRAAPGKWELSDEHLLDGLQSQLTSDELQTAALLLPRGRTPAASKPGPATFGTEPAGAERRC